MRYPKDRDLKQGKWVAMMWTVLEDKRELLWRYSCLSCVSVVRVDISYAVKSASFCFFFIY